MIPVAHPSLVFSPDQFHKLNHHGHENNHLSIYQRDYSNIVTKRAIDVKGSATNNSTSREAKYQYTIQLSQDTNNNNILPTRKFIPSVRQFQY